ncbi:hypothetical protein P5673_004957 [Acropora cervicornis]|uniref:Uncharacterized protein n=1 Tax=Acropora cervicornis TaxID=6130 RepID=A0AAD9QZ90_ACRCE|nr:hypothetical protein P5673_004957 [Acropora cervicornis]
MNLSQGVPGIMFVQRCFRRWVVGCIAVSFVGLLMLLTPRSILVDLLFGGKVYWTKRNSEEIVEMENTDLIESSAMVKQFSLSTLNPSKSHQSIFTYVYEPPVEMN